MERKADILNRIDESYLVEFYSQLLSKVLSHSNIRKKIATNLTLKKIHILRSYWDLGIPPHDAAKELQEDGSVQDIIHAFSKKFKGNNYIEKEASIGDRIPDIFLIDKKNDFWAFEIKGRRDKITNLQAQCRDYKKWADYVCILVDNIFMKKIKKDTFYKMNGIGIYNYENGVLNIIKPPKRNNVQKKMFLLSFSNIELKKCARLFSIPNNKTREETTKELLKKDLKKIKYFIRKNRLIPNNLQ